MPVPWWIEVLQAAEDWGIPPWEIVDEAGKGVWMVRWRGWKGAVSSAEHDKRKHG